jgi:hypothetical protein
MRWRRWMKRTNALVLEAFDTLFDKRDYEAAARYWAPNYIPHSAHIEPGREGLFNLLNTSPASLKYEPGVTVAEGDFIELPRSRTRVCLQDGLKLDLNALAQRGFIKFGANIGPRGIAWNHSYWGEIASGFISADMTNGYEGWLLGGAWKLRAANYSNFAVASLWGSPGPLEDGGGVKCSRGADFGWWSMACLGKADLETA